MQPKSVRGDGRGDLKGRRLGRRSTLNIQPMEDKIRQREKKAIARGLSEGLEKRIHNTGAAKVGYNI